MIEAVHIKNFRSFKEVTVNLQQVNLLIGANNSGKTNFLKVFGFVKDILGGKIEEKIFPSFIYNKNIYELPSNPLILDFVFSFGGFKYFYRIQVTNYRETKPIIGIVPTETSNIASIFENLEFNPVMFRSDGPVIDLLLPSNIDYFLINNEQKQKSKEAMSFFFNELLNSELYQINPSKITFQQQPKSVTALDSKLENIVQFLHTMKEDESEVFERILKDFRECVKEFNQINFPSDKDSVGYIKLQFTDKFGQKYLADQVSEGVLYFLALLAIIHQPMPPKILLLEEPERGIHPTRITEVVEFIFRLAEEKGIQVILSSHHPLIVEEFKDIPESIFVFDKVDGETKIKNLQTDIIEPEDIEREKSGLPKSNYTSSLTSHWAVGLIGGIPA